MSEVSEIQKIQSDPTRKPVDVGEKGVWGYKSRRQLGAELNSANLRVQYDTLTNLKRKEELADFLDKKLSSETSATMLFIDIDHFKEVNDSHADHKFGDQFLQIIGKRLSHMFPQDESTFVCRFGGEEFIVVMSGGNDPINTNVGFERAEQFRKEMENNPVTIDGESLFKTVSIGVAERRHGEPSDDWIKRADRAMYSAKEEGRNRTKVSEPK